MSLLPQTMLFQAVLPLQCLPPILPMTLLQSPSLSTRPPSTRFPIFSLSAASQNSTLARETHTIFIPSIPFFTLLPLLRKFLLFSPHLNCTNIYKCQLVHEAYHSNSNTLTLHPQHPRKVLNAHLLHKYAFPPS